MLVDTFGFACSFKAVEVTIAFVFFVSLILGYMAKRLGAVKL